MILPLLNGHKAISEDDLHIPERNIHKVLAMPAIVTMISVRQETT